MERLTKDLTCIWKLMKSQKEEQQLAHFLSKQLNSFVHWNMYESEYRTPELIGPELSYRDNWNCQGFYSHMFWWRGAQLGIFKN